MKAKLDYDKAEMLRDHCDKVGIEFMSSVFNLEGVEWAEKLGMDRYKIASRSIRRQDLLDAVGNTGKDMIVSLGMWDGMQSSILGWEDGTVADPRVSLPTHINSKGKVDYLYCVAKYPTMPEDVNFKNIDFKNKYSGFSDHTIGVSAPLIAIARGAKIIEKHFTLSKKMYGPDHQGSMDPSELKQIVEFTRKFEEFI
jgi:sialic acid synthase SpsE